MSTLKKILLLVAAFACCSSGKVHAGLFDQSSYAFGGDWDTGNAFIDFKEVGSDTDPEVGVSKDDVLGVGDIVFMYQDVTSLGSFTAGASSSPASVFAISAYQVTSITDTSTTPTFGSPVPSARAEFGALNTGEFATFLGNLGITNPDSVAIGASTTMALVSSSSDVTLSGAGTTDFSTFQIDLVAGLSGGFAQARVDSQKYFYYGFYTQQGSGSEAFKFRLGLNVEDTDDGLNSYGSISASSFTSTASVNITTQSVTALSYSNGSTELTVNRTDPTLGSYHGSLDAALLTGATVPEPSSLASLAIVALAGAATRRKRKAC